jgi:hypothetical protein
MAVESLKVFREQIGRTNNKVGFAVTQQQMNNVVLQEDQVEDKVSRNVQRRGNVFVFL